MSSAATFGEVVARLTGPGAPFEVEIVDREGSPVRAFARRERSMRELLDGVAARRPDTEFIVQGERRLSFEEFAALARGASRAMVERYGLRRGDRVAVFGANSIDWLLAVFAVTGAGAISVVLNHHWTADELDFALTDCGARFVVADTGLAAAVSARRAELPDLQHVLALDRIDRLDPRRADTPASFPALVEPAGDWPAGEIDEADPFVIMYTSGTTGRPKGCITTHRGTIAQLRSTLLNGVIEKELSAERVGGTGAADRPRRQSALLVTSPFFHVSGFHAAACLSLLTGTKVVLTSGRFDPAEALRLIETERITAWGAVPTMIHRVVDCPAIRTTDLSSLETVVSGGAPLPPDVLARARKHLGAKASLGNGYGLTETHGAVTMNAGRGLVERPTSVGRPSPLVDLRIVDDDGKEAPAGGIGEIQVRSVIVTPGYWNRPEDNAALFADGVWMRTGDLGFLDEDGFLHLTDRLKDMIIRGGENVYCIEVEDALAEAPAVSEVAVFGVPDPDLGERVAAVVTLKAGAVTDEAALQQFVAGRLAKYKVPDRIVLTRDPLPRNTTGKILKGELRTRHGAAFAGGG